MHEGTQGLAKTMVGALLVFTLVIGLPAAGPQSARAAEELSEPKELVEKAQITLRSFLEDKNMTWLRDHLKEARGVLIIPQMLKAAFFLGGSGGSGVLLVRDEETGKWSYPAFYTVGGVSFGLQFGGQASEVVLLVRTQKGVDAMLTTTVKLGAGASVAAGPVGAGVEGSTAPNLSADLLSFSRAKGIFGGLSLEGAAIAARDGWNTTYYGKPTKPVDIMVKRTVKNPHAAALRSLLGNASK